MDTGYWLKLSKDIGEKIFIEFRKYFGRDERKKILRIGFGGDETILIDDVLEKIMLDTLKSTGKSFEFISEEIGKKKIGKEPEVTIIVDPLDGSNNTRLGIPFASTSIAVSNSNKMKGVEVGYVKNLINGDYYHAIKGKGAFKNEKEIHVSKETTSCIVVDVVKDRERNFKRISKLGKNFSYVRMLGSCCLGQCFVAEGAADGYVGLSAKRTVDQTATQLIVREAGGVIKDIQGNDFKEYEIGFNIDTSTISASSESMYDKIRSVISE